MIVVIKIHWRIRQSEGLLMSQIGLVFHLLAFVLVVKIRIVFTLVSFLSKVCLYRTRLFGLARPFGYRYSKSISLTFSTLRAKCNIYLIFDCINGLGLIILTSTTSVLNNYEPLHYKSPP